MKQGAHTCLLGLKRLLVSLFRFALLSFITNYTMLFSAMLLVLCSTISTENPHLGIGLGSGPCILTNLTIYCSLLIFSSTPVYLLLFYVMRKVLIKYKYRTDEPTLRSHQLILNWKDVYAGAAMWIFFLLTIFFLIPLVTYTRNPISTLEIVVISYLLIFIGGLTGAAILIVPASLGIDGILPYRMPKNIFSVPFEAGMAIEKMRFIKRYLFLITMFCSGTCILMFIIFEYTSSPFIVNNSKLIPPYHALSSYFAYGLAAFLPTLSHHSLWVWIRKRIYSRGPVTRGAGVLLMAVCGTGIICLFTYGWNLMPIHPLLPCVNTRYILPFSFFCTLATLFTLSLP